MLLATYLLLAMAVLGGADILLFHTLAQGIRGHPASKGELWAHAGLESNRSVWYAGSTPFRVV